MIATKSKKLTALVAAVLSLLMLATLFVTPVFAEEPSSDESTTVAEPAGSDTDAESTAGTTTESSKDTTAGTTAGTGKETTKETAKETTAVTTQEDLEKQISMTTTIINLSVGAVILIVLAILAIKFRAKIPGWWKALKSECGKISWCSKDKLKKNTIVVIIIILIIVAAIAILDFAFTTGVGLLRG